MFSMKRVLALVGVSVFCFGGLTLHAMGQVSGPSSGFMRIVSSELAGNATPDALFSLRSRVEEVSVKFIVTDEKGSIATNLRKDDLRVFDDQRPVQQLRSFEQTGTQPLRIGILVDLSDSIRPEQMTEMRRAVDQLSGIFDASRDQAFLVGFSKQAQVLQSATGDIGSIGRSLRGNPGEQGLTALYDALVQTCREQFPARAEGGQEQRIVLLFSDGQDTLSMHGLDDALKAALLAKITIYALTTASDQSEGFATLKELSEKTGGRTFVLRSRHDVAKAVAGMTQSIGTEYAITFRPATGRGGFHSVRLELPGHKELHVQATSGYFLDTR
jgi:VWFA-related protein